MYKKIIFDKIILMLGLLFIFSCSNPNNPNNNGDGGFTGPTEEELIKKYGIDIGQEDTEISKQIGEKLKAYHDEMGSYRVIFTGTPKDYTQDANESLYTLTLKAAVNVNTSMNIDMDIKNIDFQDNTIKTGMFAGYGVDGSDNIVISFIFPQNKITTIGMMSFANFENTKEITLPDSVITIGERAFQNSKSIEKLNLGNRVQTIGEAAFLDVQFLSEVIIPDSVTSIESQAFANNTIQKLQLSSSLEKIGMGAFINLEVEELTIPASVKTIGDQAFAHSRQLTTVTYLGTTPSDITSPGTGIFEGCDMLTTLILPNVQSPKTEEWQNFLGGNFTTVKQQ